MQNTSLVVLVFTDLLHPCSVFSKCLQSDDIDILYLPVKNPLRNQQIEQQKSGQLAYLSCNSEYNVSPLAKTVYQSQELKKFSVAKLYFESHYIDFCPKFVNVSGLGCPGMIYS